MDDLIKIRRGDVAHYNPVDGLKHIAVAEAAERHFARAKDRTKLFEAIEEKLKAIREFVRWWDASEKDKGGNPTRRRTATGLIAGQDGLPERYVIDRWRKRTKDDVAFTRALEEAEYRCARVCEQEKDGIVRGTEWTGEFERYTPSAYIEAAREVMGGIDLDPATCEQAQQIVQATNYFTAETDGLVRNWDGRIWLNPPYHRELAPKFVSKLVAETKAGRVTAAVLLTNSCTDTKWFLTALRACNGLCFTQGRIRFAIPQEQEVGLPPQGQAFFYFGPDVERFEDVFCAIGVCVRLSRDFAGGH